VSSQEVFSSVPASLHPRHYVIDELLRPQVLKAQDSQLSRSEQWKKKISENSSYINLPNKIIASSFPAPPVTRLVLLRLISPAPENCIILVPKGGVTKFRVKLREIKELKSQTTFKVLTWVLRIYDISYGVTY
jgi:hypothetical protein